MKRKLPIEKEGKRIKAERESERKEIREERDR